MPEWRTYSIRVNGRNRKAVAIQARFPLTGAEWDRFMDWLDGNRPDLVSDEVKP